jgi:lipid-A-disaccharide synthase-like uncharacterized protein
MFQHTSDVSQLYWYCLLLAGCCCLLLLLLQDDHDSIMREVLQDYIAKAESFRWDALAAAAAALVHSIVVTQLISSRGDSL